ncbi:unnamed protein product [Meganyctiphanes norvegica]|uniref:GATOR2 complex protein MIO zinc-ribbon like domain-containing protein n=1 Tax=Meganyctiphanes norvegica TaxID=48144 RepID=A0AAV2SVA4_MEGNR
MQSCPNCRKPLPRCSLCLVHMGTPSGWSSTAMNKGAAEEGSGADMSTPTGDSAPSVGSRKLSDFSTWFTWCQMCRHGGHANHMMDWFKEHAECPVTSCSCKCMAIDAVSKVSSTSTVVTAK